MKPGVSMIGCAGMYLDRALFKRRQPSRVGNQLVQHIQKPLRICGSDPNAALSDVMYPTIAEILEIPSVARGLPRVRSGRAALDTRIRWVHVNEQQNPAGSLSGGELILSIGVPASDPTTNLVEYISMLKSAGAAGLMIEIGQHVQALPQALVQHARAISFPLIELRQSVRFIDVTEAVHGIILNQHYARLKFTERVAQVFRGLAVSGATVEQVVTEAAALLTLPVVLEDLGHRALCIAGGNPEEVLRDWMSRSRQTPGVTSGDGPRGWEVAPIGRRHNRWGRLIVAARKTGDERVAMVLAHASDTLTLLRLANSRNATPTQDAQEKILADLFRSPQIPGESLLTRARALGLNPSAAYGVLMLATCPQDAEHLMSSISAATHRLGLAAVVGRVTNDHLAVIMPNVATDGNDQQSLERIVAALPPEFVRAVGCAQSANLNGVPDALVEAAYISDVVNAGLCLSTRRVWRYGDIGIRGLLWNLRSDSRLLSFADEQLAPVLRKESGDDRKMLLKSLRAYIDSNGVIATFAKHLDLSRQTAYARAGKLSRVLGKDLTDPVCRLDLHVALIALDLIERDVRGVVS
ncbi:purine catabolism regulator [Rhodococcus sp. 27YEA15]|uniref:PucR family transcriptional regulator n=1 Tax=Rhodococcus sp. 27YEA15 TaxID=3156259 RepID=UPI003C7B1907